MKLQSKIIYDKKNEFLEDFREISLVGSLNKGFYIKPKLVSLVICYWEHG